MTRKFKMLVEVDDSWSALTNPEIQDMLETNENGLGVTVLECEPVEM